MHDNAYAIWQRKAKAGLIMHTDRSSQYASHQYRNLLLAHGIKGSMSRKGDCWDTAVAESFFGSLKQERVQWQKLLNWGVRKVSPLSWLKQATKEKKRSVGWKI
jgi:transposase InsO family protein